MSSRRAPSALAPAAFGLLMLALFTCRITAAADLVSDSGFSASRLDRLDHVIDEYVERKELAGAVTLVARDGQVVRLHVAGYEDVESGTPMRADSIFRLYSMTKPVTATALLTLFEQGYFQLDDPLAKYLPEFRDVKVYAGVADDGGMKLVAPERPITIRDILTHTGGISYGNDDHPVDRAYRAAGIVERSQSVQDIVRKIATMPLRQQPGTEWHYSFSADIQACLIERLSGMPFEKYLEERIFRPLGMQDTSFDRPAAKRGRFTSMYSPPGGFEGRSPFMLEMEPGLVRIEGPDSPARAWPSGGSGLNSTAQDYFRFAQMLVNGGELDGVRVLSPMTVRLMTAAHVPMGFPGLPDILVRGSGYGLGVSVMVDPLVAGNVGTRGQFGWSGAASTHVIMDPHENLVALLMVQYRPSLVGLRRQFQTLVYQALVTPHASRIPRVRDSGSTPQ